MNKIEMEMIPRIVGRLVTLAGKGKEELVNTGEGMTV